MKLTTEMTDAAVLEELGARLHRRRIDADLTQAQLAEEAGVSKRTVERIEAGHSTDLAMLIRVLRDRKSTRLNSSHLVISYAVFCLKKKKTKNYAYLTHLNVL